MARVLRSAGAAVVSVVFLAIATTGAGIAHNGVVHATAEEARAHAALDTPNTPGFPAIKGGDYALVDHTGKARTSRDPEGRHQLVFFGYATCQAICSVALPRMAAAVERLDASGIAVTPVLITVDAKRDTVANLASAVKKIHPRMVGLTGETEALEAAYRAFQVERQVVFVHPEHGEVFSHGSYIYLLGPNGRFETLLPPVLGVDRIVEVVESYVIGERGERSKQ